MRHPSALASFSGEYASFLARVQRKIPNAFERVFSSPGPRGGFLQKPMMVEIDRPELDMNVPKFGKYSMSMKGTFISFFHLVLLIDLFMVSSRSCSCPTAPDKHPGRIGPASINRRKGALRLSLPALSCPRALYIHDAHCLRLVHAWFQAPRPILDPLLPFHCLSLRFLDLTRNAKVGGTCPISPGRLFCDLLTS